MDMPVAFLVGNGVGVLGLLSFTYWMLLSGGIHVKSVVVEKDATIAWQREQIATLTAQRSAIQAEAMGTVLDVVTGIREAAEVERPLP